MKNSILFIILAFLLGFLGFTSNISGTQKVVQPLKPANEIWVMVIDTGISPHIKLKPYLQLDSTKNYIDAHGHGTHVAGILAYGNQYLNDPLCSNVKIFSCNYGFDPKNPNGSIDRTVECVKQATSMKMDYLNYSAGGTEWTFKEYLAFREFDDQGGIAYVAAGNYGRSLDDEYGYYPASYKFGFKFLGFDGKIKRAKTLNNMVVVQNQCPGGGICNSSNTHPQAIRAMGDNVFSTLPNHEFGRMSGTSQASPMALHLTLKQRCIDIKNGVQQQ